MKYVQYVLIFTAVLLVCAGCSTNKQETRTEIETSLRTVFGFEVTSFKANLNDDFKTTPVHPADAGFLVGQTSVNPDATLGFAPKAGVFVLSGTKWIRLVGGLSARLNPLGFTDSYKQGIYGRKQQVSDPRPADQGSFVFSQVVPTWWTLTPSVGVEVGDEPITVGASVGFPYMGWEARSGHDRWGKWQTVQEESWTGFGRRYSLDLSYRVDKETRFVVELFQEGYNPGFGSVKNTGACFWFVVPLN